MKNSILTENLSLRGCREERDLNIRDLKGDGVAIVKN